MTAWFTKANAPLTAEEEEEPPVENYSRGTPYINPEDAAKKPVLMSEVMVESNRSLTLLSQARNAIAEVRTFDELKGIRDKAEAARKYAQAAGMGLEIQNYAAEVKLRAERRAGELLAELNLHGGDRREETATKRLTLEDVGVSKDQSSRWQLAAKVPDENFEEFLSDAKEKKEEVTTAGLVRLAQSLRAKPSPKPDSAPEPEYANCRVVSCFDELLGNGDTFACVYLDPPWPGDADNDAFVMALAEVPMQKLSEAHAHIHIWATDDSLFAAKEAIENWGFEFQGCLVATSSQARKGEFWAEAHEYLLLGVRGDLAFMEKTLSSVMRLGRDSAGRIDEKIREIIERVSPGPYLEIFGRRKASNWTIYSSFLDGEAGTLQEV